MAHQLHRAKDVQTTQGTDSTQHKHTGPRLWVCHTRSDNFLRLFTCPNVRPCMQLKHPWQPAPLVLMPQGCKHETVESGLVTFVQYPISELCLDWNLIPILDRIGPSSNLDIILHS